MHQRKKCWDIHVHLLVILCFKLTVCATTRSCCKRVIFRWLCSSWWLGTLHTITLTICWLRKTCSCNETKRTSCVRTWAIKTESSIYHSSRLCCGACIGLCMMGWLSNFRNCVQGYWSLSSRSDRTTSVLSQKLVARHGLTINSFSKEFVLTWMYFTFPLVNVIILRQAIQMEPIVVKKVLHVVLTQRIISKLRLNIGIQSSMVIEFFRDVHLVLLQLL